MKKILFLLFLGITVSSFSQELKKMKSDPVVCINSTCDGYVINKSTFHFGGLIKLTDPKVDFIERFTVTQWEIKANGRSLKGEGKELNANAIKMLRDPSVHKIEISVSGVHDDSQTKIQRKAEFELKGSASKTGFR